MESRKIRPVLDGNGNIVYPLTHSRAVSDSNGTVHDKLVAIQNQFETYVPIEITGDVTNAPDEEDITSDSNNLLKFKNRNALNGKGYVILRSGELTPQLTQSNTIYEVRYNHNITSESPITLPPNCILYFNGGMISDGTLIGDNTVIDQVGLYDYFENITREGTWVCMNLSEVFNRLDEEDLKLSVLQATTENHTEEIEELQTTVSGYTSEIEDLQTDVEGLQTTVSGHTSKIEDLQTDVENLQTTVGGHTSKIEDLQTDVEGLQTTVGGHTSEIEDLQTDVETNTSDISGLQTSKQDVLTFANTTTCEEIINELH